MMDVTMGTETAVRDTRGWKVDTETETLSEHKYIKIKIEKRSIESKRSRGKKSFPRWNIKELDKDWFTASVVSGDWLMEHRFKKLIGNSEIEKAERILKTDITDACDDSMKRVKVGKNRRNKVFWWNTKIAEIRGRCNMWRRRLIRAKCRKDPEQVSQLAGKLKNGRKN